jgi:hypothetical protein
MGYTVASWLRHCATNRKVAVSISDGVTGLFNWNKPSGRNMGLLYLFNSSSSSTSIAVVVVVVICQLVVTLLS